MLVFSCSRLCVTSSGCRRTVDSSGHTMSDGMGVLMCWASGTPDLLVLTPDVVTCEHSTAAGVIVLLSQGGEEVAGEHSVQPEHDSEHVVRLGQGTLGPVEVGVEGHHQVGGRQF